MGFFIYCQKNRINLIELKICKLFKSNILFFILVFITINTVSQNDRLKEVDSVLVLLDGVKNTSKSFIERLSYAENAKILSNEISNDSLLNQALRYIAVHHYNLKNYNLFKKASKEYLIQSLKIRDSSNLARANGYLGEFYSMASVSDSAYFYFYRAEKIYKALNDEIELGKILRNIAVIQKNEKDYIGSEVTTIEAIALLEPYKETRILSALYNNLGIIYNELGDYDEAIKYHEKTLELKSEFKKRNILLEGSSFNNMAVVFKNALQYDKAIKNFSFILENKDFRKKRPEFYAMVLDNYAHTKFLLNQNEDLPELFYDALKVCDSIDNRYNTITINMHLSEYYQSINKIDSAKKFAYSANEVAKNFHNDDYLKTLLHLSKIEEDSLAVKYYQEYIALNDSLQDNEREIRNKFARIRYETKEIEQKNERITKERLYLLILSIGLLLTILLTYSVISQRAKNKELKFTQQQQEVNEEIYNLMLSQQDKIDEGRAHEKKRISEELHDGVLGRLFGTRLSLDSLNSSTKDDAVKNRSVYIDELKSIEQEIRKISHDLNTDFIAGSSYFDIIKTLVINQTQAYQLNYELKKTDDINWDLVSNKTKINLYRIVQESLQNIYKHANATHVVINFNQEDDFILLNITDNGSGFEVNKARKGIGLKNIRSRVAELNGEVKIESEKNYGTRVKISVPV
jgi:signal transduction histidine kinase